MQVESQQLQARDRVRRRLSAALTPEQRLSRLAALLEHCSQVLTESPQAMDRFWRRNLRKRAIRRDPTWTP
jgi:hypothetical protein